MKPIIIKLQVNSKGKFELTEDELNDIIEKAYQSGLSDGSHNTLTIPSTPLINPAITPYYTTVTAKTDVKRQDKSTEENEFFF